MPCFYLTPKQDDFNQIPELQVCIAEALYDAEAVLVAIRVVIVHLWSNFDLVGRYAEELRLLL